MALMEKYNHMRIIQSLTNQAVIADKCLEAKSFWLRLRGLIGRSSLADGEGMLFPTCNNIHMWFMTISIDVVFLRKEDSVHGKNIWKISSVHQAVKPWRILPLMDLRATDTLELPRGTVSKFSLCTGDEVCIN